MKLLDLFSGIGGFSLAASWTGIETVAFCEIDDYCRRVLAKNFPGVPIHEDIRKFKRESISGTVDIISGGFPCQPFSTAGKRRGKEDDRYLWPEMLRVISEVRPAWVLGENVAGIVNMELDKVLSDLEVEGYSCEAFIIPACAVDAPHRRDRVWIVGHANGNSKSDGAEYAEMAKLSTLGHTSQFGRNETFTPEPRKYRESTGAVRGSSGTVANAESEQTGGLFERRFPANVSADRDWTGQAEAWSTEPGICGVANGISNRVDRLGGLGNAIVPQVAYRIFRAIVAVEEQIKEQSA